MEPGAFFEITEHQRQLLSRSLVPEEELMFENNAETTTSKGSEEEMRTAG